MGNGEICINAIDQMRMQKLKVKQQRCLSVYEISVLPPKNMFDESLLQT